MPEQIRGDPIDHRADIYALGATLYQMLTGTIPFTRTTPAAMLQAHLFEPPPRPSAADPALPTTLDDVIAIAMAKDPEHRYDSCRSLAAAATRALEPSAPQLVSSDLQGAAAVSPPGAIEFAQPRAHRSRSRTTTIVAATAVAVLTAAVAIALTSRGARTLSGIGIPADTTTAVRTTTSSAPSTSSSASTAWGRDNDLVALFTTLLPATPADSGYQGARCTDLTVLNNGAAPTLECTQDNGIHWYVWSFRRGDPRRDSTFRTNIDNDTTRQTTWTRPSGTGNVRWSYYPGANTGLLTVSFDDPTRAWVVIDVNWDHHTGQELYDQWWTPAPL
ncbi:hypothetical protein OG874_29080 [Nocardia sp. NBC_00565]|uniref:serine/threonine protein kinase n=1 Tax=Nocardia sp. NBC_00565 TaxID=2975993 RepID=UPI002E80BDB4|nr:hypothetical protein [Nocardia sp. NBC_00565]WUC08353.1 hypothetical protein OG874_29080 [Nocardia sp. NBC_00565]